MALTRSEQPPLEPPTVWSWPESHLSSPAMTAGRRRQHCMKDLLVRLAEAQAAALAAEHYAIVPVSTFWGDVVVVHRQGSPLLPSPQLPVANKPALREKRGLSSYMLELNKSMKAARENGGGGAPCLWRR